MSRFTVDPAALQAAAAADEQAAARLAAPAPAVRQAGWAVTGRPATAAALAAATERLAALLLVLARAYDADAAALRAAAARYTAADRRLGGP